TGSSWLTNNETWELRLGITPTWKKLIVPGQIPSPRFAYSAVFDSLTDRLFVFGGQDGAGHAFNDIFSMSTLSSQWTQLIADGQPGSPSPRVNASVVLDPVRRRLVFFGGGELGAPGGFHNDCWAFPLDEDPPAWQQTPTSNDPALRGLHEAVYDAVHDRMVVHGGVNSTSPLYDAFALPFTGPSTWEPLPTDSIGYGLTGVYDLNHQRMLVPSINGTRELDLGASPAWSSFEEHIPPGTRGGAVVTDTHQLVVVGGVENYGGAWTTSWSLDLTNPAGQWTRLDAVGPADRDQMAMVWDPLRARILGFGGVARVGGPGGYNDLWSLTLQPPTWTQLTTTGNVPVPGYGWRGLYDPSGDRLVFLSFDHFDPPGGVLPPGWLNAIYTLPLSGPSALPWTRHDIFPPSFKRRRAATFSYDPGRDAGWIYGGDDSTGTGLTDAWKVDLVGVPSASPWTPVGSLPPGRVFHSAMFDPVRDRLVIFGGSDGLARVPKSDAWALDLGAGNQWHPLDIFGGPPQARYFAPSAYDPASDRFLVTQGTGGSGESLIDTWALELAPLLGVCGPSSHAGAQLARHGPHPDRGDVAVDYALPSPGSATIELLDVGGRLLRSEHVDVSRPAARMLTLARRGELDPGVYFVRLRIPGAERSLR